MLLLYFVTGVATFLIWSTIWPLLRNLSTARKLGLPVVVSPVDPLNIPWLLVADFVIPPLRGILPFYLSQWTYCSQYGGTHTERTVIHKLYGPVFLIAHPAGIELSVADPAAADDILKRRKDFVKDGKLYRKFAAQRNDIAHWFKGHSISSDPTWFR